MERVTLIDEFMPKIEEWVEQSGGKIRGDVVFERLDVGGDGYALTRCRAAAFFFAGVGGEG